MQADRLHVLPGTSEFCAEIRQTADAGKDRHVRFDTAFFQDSCKALCPAVEACVAGIQNGKKRPVFAFDRVGDILCGNGAKRAAAGRFNAFQHALRAEEHICCFDRFLSFRRQRSFRAHADADHDDFLAFRSELKLFFEQRNGLRQRVSLFFFDRSSDDDSLRAAFLCGCDLIFIAACASRVFRDHPFRLHHSQHSGVHVAAEGAPDRHDAVCGKSALRTGAQGVLERKHSGIDAFFQ